MSIVSFVTSVFGFDLLGFGFCPWVVGFLCSPFVFPCCAVLLYSYWASSSVGWVVLVHFAVGYAVDASQVVWAVSLGCGVHGVSIFMGY